MRANNESVDDINASQSAATVPAGLTGGAVGAGLVLVLLPCVGLLFGLPLIAGRPEVELPILAIFGIMILFGSMSLISTLFARLSLSDGREALALPPGSIRAAIALSLIVLFAIISIMLFQTMAKPYVISGLTKDDKNLIIGTPSNRVLAVVPCLKRAAPAGAGTATEDCFDVHVVQPPGQESFDLAKQLLVMIGTLMTSVTSFYFATQSTAAARKSVFGDTLTAAAAGAASQSIQAATSVAAPVAPEKHDDEHADGCDVPISQPTADADLPPTRGGVA